MKEGSNVLIPEYIKTIFPIITHINIFSFIKKTENYKKQLIIQFRDIKNEIKYVRITFTTSRSSGHDGFRSKLYQTYKDRKSVV